MIVDEIDELLGDGDGLFFYFVGNFVGVEKHVIGGGEILFDFVEEGVEVGGLLELLAFEEGSDGRVEVDGGGFEGVGFEGIILMILFVLSLFLSFHGAEEELKIRQIAMIMLIFDPPQ